MCAYIVFLKSYFAIGDIAPLVRLLITQFRLPTEYSKHTPQEPFRRSKSSLFSFVIYDLWFSSLNYRPVKHMCQHSIITDMDMMWLYFI